MSGSKLERARVRGASWEQAGVRGASWERAGASWSEGSKLEQGE